MFKRILTATDITNCLDAPVLAAANLARQNQASLFVLHVMESASTSNRHMVRHFETGEEQIADNVYKNHLRNALKKTYADCLASLSYEICITAGFPWEEILKWSRHLSSDLITLGPHSSRAQEKGVARFSGGVGSTTEKVVTREQCPVMIVNPPIAKSTATFRKALVCVDFSKSCECGVCFAARFERHFGCKLLLFHMIPVPPYPKYSREDYNADLRNSEKRLTALYDIYLEQTDHQYLIRPGALPHQEILQCAEKNDIDIIIMGSHTKEKSGKWYPGSAVERVSYQAKCPVIIITDPEALQPWGGTLKTDSQAGTHQDHLIHVFSGSYS